MDLWDYRDKGQAIPYDRLRVARLDDGYFALAGVFSCSRKL